MNPRPPRHPPVSILMYHQIGKFDTPRQHRATFCDVDRFRRQMTMLHYGGYRVISLSECVRGLFEGAPLPARSVVLTFDDGYQNFADHAFPILSRFGFPATVFLVAGRLGQPAQWLIDDRRAGPALMSVATLRDLAREGVSFGAHSMTHPRLGNLPSERQREEIFASKAHLEAVLSMPIDDFCYPYGHYDKTSPRLVAEAGFRCGLTCIRGAANTAESRFEIPRKAISYGDSLLGVGWKLHFKHRRKDRAAQGPVAAAS